MKREREKKSEGAIRRYTRDTWVMLHVIYAKWMRMCMTFSGSGERVNSLCSRGRTLIRPTRQSHFSNCPIFLFFSFL